MDKKARRNALKALAVGAPAIWAKPVVDSVVIPAHAVTSTCPPCTPFNGSWFTLTPVSESPCPELTWEVQFFSDSACSAILGQTNIYFGPIDAFDKGADVVMKAGMGAECARGLANARRDGFAFLGGLGLAHNDPVTSYFIFNM